MGTEALLAFLSYIVAWKSLFLSGILLALVGWKRIGWESGLCICGKIPPRVQHISAGRTTHGRKTQRTAAGWIWSMDNL